MLCLRPGSHTNTSAQQVHIIRLYEYVINRLQGGQKKKQQTIGSQILNNFDTVNVSLIKYSAHIRDPRIGPRHHQLAAAIKAT